MVSTAICTKEKEKYLGFLNRDIQILQKLVGGHPLRRSDIIKGKTYAQLIIFTYDIIMNVCQVTNLTHYHNFLNFIHSSI